MPATNLDQAGIHQHLFQHALAGLEVAFDDEATQAEHGLEGLGMAVVFSHEAVLGVGSGIAADCGVTAMPGPECADAMYT